MVVGHGELDLWRGAAAETTNAATTLVHRPNGEVEELKEAMVELRVVCAEWRRDDDDA